MFGKIIEKISYNLSDEHFSFKSILLILFISAIIICIIYYIAKAIEGGKEKKNFRNIRVNTNKKANLGNGNIDNINGIVENIITKGISNIRNWFSNTSKAKDNIKNISNNNNYNSNYNNKYNERYINYSEDNYYNANNYNYNDNYNNEEIYYNNSDVIDEIDYIDSIDSIDDIANAENVTNISNDNNVNNNGFGFKFNTNRKNTIYHDEEDDFF